MDSGIVLPAETPALGYVTNKPEGTRLQGGSGRPRICYQMDGPRDFHDGGGLCSPGRWARERREHAAGESWEWLRDKIREIVIKRIGSEEELEKEAFRMAEGGEEGCRLARDPELQKEILELLKTWIEGQDLSEPGLLEIPEGQPLRLRLLRAILEAADDPDRDYLHRAEEGLPLGILEGLPRTPHVFEDRPPGDWIRVAGNRLWRGFRTMPR